MIKYRGGYYDAVTGERREAIVVQGADVVDLDLKSQGYTVKDKRESGIPYVYRTRDKKKFFMSYSLTPFYLRDVAYDYLGVSKSAGLVVETPSFLIAFLGAKMDVLHSSDPEERRAFLESFFQGIEYKTVPLEELVKAVSPSVPLILVLLTFLIVVAVFAYVAYYALFSAGNEELQEAATPPPPPPPPTEFVDVATTQATIDGLINFPLKPVEAIKNIDFSTGRIKLISIVPQVGFKKGTAGFERDEVSLFPYARDIKIFKKGKACFNLLVKYTDDVLYVGTNQVALLVSGTFPLEQFKEFVKDVKGCPVSFRGYANLLPDFRKERVHIRVTLYFGFDADRYNALSQLLMKNYVKGFSFRRH